MSFRASHYFVSFMSEASAIAAGFGGHVVGTQLLWHFTVTQPHNIEVGVIDILTMYGLAPDVGAKVSGGGGGQLEPPHAQVVEAVCVQANPHQTWPWSCSGDDLCGEHSVTRLVWPAGRGAALPRVLHLGGAQPQGEAQ